MSIPDARITVLIPAFQEATRIAATVTAARALPGVTRVLVIDDGSTDDTGERAARAGAEVLRLPVNSGKGAALRAGLAACPGDDDDIFLLLDADLGASASEAAGLLQPVLADVADLTIARFPATPGRAGFGLVKGLAHWGTWLLTRRRLHAPISGQRACRRWVLTAAPIANGYGAETAMNVAAGDAGARIVEVPVAMHHAATGRDWAGFRHRGRQFVHVLGALAAAACGRTGEPLLLPHIRLTCSFPWVLALVIVSYYTMVAAGFWHDDAAILLDADFPGQWIVPGIWLAVFLGPLLTTMCSGLLRGRRKNFRGRYIPALGGALVLPAACYLWWAALPGPRPESSPAVIQAGMALPLLLLGWMLLGLVDDLYGAGERKGFGGHFGALRRGRLTTGGVKLLGGGLLALLMAYFLLDREPRWLTIPLAALLIAFMANFINLFDLRPGRALKVFWMLAIPLTIMAAQQALPLPFVLACCLLLLATLVYAPLDFAGMMMLGDMGANPLGALLGCALVLLLPLWGQVIVVALLIGLHVYAERVSLTQVIERVPVLRWFDRLGRCD